MGRGTMMRVVVSSAMIFCASRAEAKGEPPIGHKRTLWERPQFAAHKQRAMKFGDDYRRFLTANKTEREVVAAAIGMATQRGYRDLFSEPIKGGLRPGAKLYAVVHRKLAALIVLGRQPIASGVHVVASHVDAVRIDLKQRPLYADGNMALLQTHYYGGIKSYQWLSLPLELRGVVVKRDGSIINVAIGDDPSEPVFVIPDVAVHVSRQVDRKEGEELPAELLDPIVASTPARGKGTDRYAREAARVLKTKYGIDVADLVSAELELVPALAARDVGIDRALIGGYGQDDRACTYAALRAIFDVRTPAHTAIVILADKEEIGSTGNTGVRSNFMRRVLVEVIAATGKVASPAAIERALSASLVFAADVTGAVNPHYKEIYERRNASFLGSGVVWNQSAVHSEVMAYVRRLFDSNRIGHQPSRWSRSRGSKSERGTVLPFFTQLGMNGLNVSIPLLSMHSPFEVLSKADLYEGYRAYRAFLSD